MVPALTYDPTNLREVELMLHRAKETLRRCEELGREHGARNAKYYIRELKKQRRAARQLRAAFANGGSAHA